MRESLLEIKAGRWAWFEKSEHGTLRTSPFRDLFADLERLEEHNPVLCLNLGPPKWAIPARDMRLTDLGFYAPDFPGEALKRLPAGLAVIDCYIRRETVRLVVGRKGAAAGPDTAINPSGHIVAASATSRYLNDSPYARAYPYRAADSSGLNIIQLNKEGGDGVALTAIRASPLKDIYLWDIRPGPRKKADDKKDDSRITGYDAPDGCALTVLQKLGAKLRTALDGYGCTPSLKCEGKTPAEQLDSVVAGTEPRFWLAEVRNAYMPPDHGLARHLEETYNRLLKRKGSRFLYWRARRLAAACRRAGLDAPPRVIKGLSRLKKLRRAETGKNG